MWKTKNQKHWNEQLKLTDEIARVKFFKMENLN